MALSEAARSDLYAGFCEVFGTERAETLMSVIPLHDLDEVATKGDIAQLREGTRADIAELRTELKDAIGDLRASMHLWMTTVLLAVIVAMVGIGVMT